ncbi:MAG TPA: hypothetical protein ENN19_16480 [Chloroflexi bacterium]|nr:hypothetical protein [Chloroflexota bacterium]
MIETVSIVTDFDLTLNISHVLEGQGVDPQRARPAICDTAREVLDEARELLAPIGMYGKLLVRDFRHQRVTLGDGTDAVFEGPLVARALAGAEEVALIVCTIGSALEERVGAMNAAGDILHALALDGAGVAALRQVSQALSDRVRRDASARGLGSGMRAQPGQEGWSIWQQRVLFDLLPADQIGVRLTESCLMLPRKSVSVVIGVGPDMRPDAVACDFCSKRGRCQWRVDDDPSLHRGFRSKSQAQTA